MSRDRGVCPGIFAPAFVLEQRDNGTPRLPDCPGTSPGTSSPLETLIRSHCKTLQYFHSILWDYSIVFLGQQRTTGKRPGEKALKDKYIITSPFFSLSFL